MMTKDESYKANDLTCFKVLIRYKYKDQVIRKEESSMSIQSLKTTQADECTSSNVYSKYTSYIVQSLIVC